MSALLAFDVGWGTTLAIKAVVVLAVVPLTALILGYIFLLKMMSHMQSRLGPMDPGGFHGWYQLVGDGVKFLQKEDIMPADADRRVFALAPAIVVMSTFLVFVVIPAGPRLVVAEPLRAGGGIEIVEVQRHFIDGRLRQIDPGAVGLLSHERPPIDRWPVPFR